MAERCSGLVTATGRPASSVISNGPRIEKRICVLRHIGLGRNGANRNHSTLASEREMAVIAARAGLPPAARTLTTHIPVGSRLWLGELPRTGRPYRKPGWAA
jgi:hypothetical protein